MIMFKTALTALTVLIVAIMLGVKYGVKHKEDYESKKFYILTTKISAWSIRVAVISGVVGALMQTWR